MKKTVLAFLLYLAVLLLNAKEKILYLELENEVFVIENCNFYISTVIDERADTTTIGFAQTGAFNKKVNAKLKGGVEVSFYDFISSSLPKQNNFSEIVLKIQELKISEFTTFSSETGEAILKVHFYAYNQNNELVNVFETKSFVNEQGLDVTKGHENRIRLAIIDCLKKFSTSSWQENLNSPPIIAENLDSNSVNLTTDISSVNQIILNDKNPKFSYHGRSYMSLAELKSVILKSEDQNLIDDFGRYKNTQSIANVFAGIGGGLIGYPLGAAITTGRLNTDMMLSGVGFFVVALIIQGKANKLAAPVIESFNAQSTTARYFNIQQDNTIQFGYTFRF